MVVGRAREPNGDEETMNRMNGTDLLVGACLLMLWHAAGLSWWLLVGMVVLATLINMVPFMRRFYEVVTLIAAQTRAKMIAEYQSRIRADTEERLKKAEARPHKDSEL